MPKVNSMKKKMIAQKGANGIMLIACGYVMKMRPGPFKIKLIINPH
jgi:hypothetical protein